MTGAIYNPNGIDLKAAYVHMQKTGGLAGFAGAEPMDPDELLTMKVDVLIPAALGGVIDADVARKLQCRILAEGANGPVTSEGDEVLRQRQDETSFQICSECRWCDRFVFRMGSRNAKLLELPKSTNA